MQVAELLFEQYQNSFKVNILNLESLDVSTIQQFQEFVQIRKGIFDFNNYSFTIQKRIECLEFVTLLKHLGIDANVQEKIELVKSEPRIGFGQYKGMQYSELSDSYLKWLQSNYRGFEKDYIMNEIQRRSL